MRAFSTDLKNPLATGATTLCSCWEITRRDAVVYRYTDHDEDVTAGGDTFATVGASYSSTEVSANTDLSVDNLELDVIFGDIDRNDILAGLYDDAQVKFWLVNWANPDLSGKILRGWFGELTVTDEGIRGELRGMLQRLQQRTGLVISPGCRYDLGDARCGVDIGALTVSSTAENPVTLIELTNRLCNVTTGWTVQTGVLNVRTSNPAPFEGAGYFGFGNSATSLAYQDIDVSGDSASIDNNQAMIAAGWRQAGFGDGDTGEVILDFLSAAGVSLGTVASGLFTSSQVWTERSIAPTSLPVGTRTVRFKLRGVRAAGSNLDAYFDAIDPLDFYVPQKDRFADSSRTEPAGYFDGGLVTFTGGQNAGASMEIKSWDGVTFILWEPLFYPVTAGDPSSATPGCDKLFATCRDTYSNALRFGGEPHLPGYDVILQKGIGGVV